MIKKPRFFAGFFYATELNYPAFGSAASFSTAKANF